MSSFRAKAAIVGLGVSEIGRVYGRTAAEFAADAVANAVADAGLRLSDVDGVLTSDLVNTNRAFVASTLGLRNQGLSVNMFVAGATAGAAVQYAAMAVLSGMASTVVYVHAACPLQDPTKRTPYGGAWMKPTGYGAMNTAIGLSGANQNYALLARRHMAAFGTTSEHFGAVAVAQRQWAMMNPLAQEREPMTLEDHQNSRMVADPFRLYDCSLVSNGAVAVVITTAERARDLAQPPAYLWGWGQCHPFYPARRGSEQGLVSGAGISGRTALDMAGISLDQIGVREFYDCYTYAVLITLEDYGFVAKGESGPLAMSGALGPGGSMPTNTGGGQLSAFYLGGATPLHEAVVQARGDAGERQVADHDFILCSGNGGYLEHHSTLILGANPTS